MPQRRHYPFRSNYDFSDRAYEMSETKTSPSSSQFDEEDQRGGGVSEHFRAKLAEADESGHWNAYFRDYD